MRRGYVYVLYNPMMEGLVKIGFTAASSEARAGEIFRGNGMPTRFLVVHEIRVNNREAVERRVHKRLAAQRGNPKREFFRVPLKEPWLPSRGAEKRQGGE